MDFQIITFSRTLVSWINSNGLVLNIKNLDIKHQFPNGLVLVCYYKKGYLSLVILAREATSTFYQNKYK